MLRTFQIVVSVLGISLLSACNQTTGEDWNTQASDVHLTGEELGALVVGNRIDYSDGGTSRIRPDGSYVYTSAEGQRFPASYDIRSDGVVCLEFPAGGSRCDKFVKSGEQLVLINQRGSRYTVTDISPLQE